jgi:hypothetical protein
MKYGSAWTLNARKPVEKPQAHRAGDIKNHLAKLDLVVVLCRVHVVSLTLVDRFLIPMLKLTTRARAEGIEMEKNSKTFDIIVLAGMVVNIILAVFLILYYFDFL